MNITGRTSAPRPSLSASRLGAIALGGGFGTLARYALDEAFPAATGVFPWTTLGINVAGAFFLAVLIVVLLGRESTAGPLQPFAAVGFFGAFTTYSAFATESVLLVRDGRVGLAAAYLSATLLVGIAAVVAGIWAARSLVRRFA